MRAISRELFGHSHFAAVALAISERPDPFYLGEIAKAVGAQGSAVYTPFHRLERAGLIRRLLLPPGDVDWRSHARPRGRPAKYYERRPSAFWTMLPALITEYDGDEPEWPGDIRF